MGMWTYNHTEYLCHYGIKGMKWGVRKSKTYAKSNLRGRIGIQFFAKNSEDYPTVKLGEKEYARVMHELHTHITPAQRTYPVFYKNIGKYTYMFENKFNDEYRVIGKNRIYTPPKRSKKGKR